MYLGGHKKAEADVAAPAGEPGIRPEAEAVDAELMKRDQAGITERFDGCDGAAMMPGLGE